MDLEQSASGMLQGLTLWEDDGTLEVFPISRAGSNGGCNTIQCFDSRMVPRQNPSVWPYSIET